MTALTIEQMRTLHGRSAAAWVGEGTHIVGDAHWIALSGARHVDYNMALCHGLRGAEHVTECLDAITATRRPSIIALAGEARDTDQLAQAGWAHVGTAPLMMRSTAGAGADPAARRLDPADLPFARALVGEVFGLPPEIAEVALTVDAKAIPNRAVWGLFEADQLVAAVILMEFDTTMVGWSMAVTPQARRRGYGRRLMDTALAAGREAGFEQIIMHSSALGEPLYLAGGFEVVERWDFWSRRRWILSTE